MEPQAKKVLSLSGIDIPKNHFSPDLKGAVAFAKNIGYPVAAKVVSPKVIHKTDVGGVALGIEDESQLVDVYNRFKATEAFEGVLVEEMIAGEELIVGAKTDYQFGPVILLGIGGTGVEIYKDTALKMAPLSKSDVISMINTLTAKALINGYRGSRPVDIGKLVRLMVDFSHFAMDLAGEFETIDLNPVMCSPERCVVADARIMLKGGLKEDQNSVQA